MGITCGCVFVDIAKATKKDTENTLFYDWENKITVPLSQDNLDSLIYLLSFYEKTLHIMQPNKVLTFAVDNEYTIKTDKVEITDSLTPSQANGLRIMLEKAKVKTYGW